MCQRYVYPDAARAAAWWKAITKRWRRECRWTFDWYDGYWDTACGQAWIGPDGAPPSAHGVRFCPFCGRRIAEHGEDHDGRLG